MSLSNFSYYLRDYRLWMVIGLVGAAALAHYGEAEARQIGIWVAIVLAGLLVLALLVWVVKRMLARRAAKRVEAMVKDEADKAVASAQPAQRADTEALRQRRAVRTALVRDHRQPGGRQEHRDPQFGPAVPVRGQPRQRRAGHRRYP
ncbi:hypothetical protein G6F35_016604 [Rhizopus arrhizus]|nr:hypothetical protein G6F35_016604 [Rhizopus arrhizus]